MVNRQVQPPTKWSLGRRCSRSDVEVLVDDIVAREALISESRKPQLRRLIHKLIEKLETNEARFAGCRW